jgi:LmbE family N-acetylglucosaminyl deacetylase
METHVAHKILGCQVAGWWPRLSAPDLIAAGTFPAGRIAEDVQLSVAAFGPELILSPSSAELHAQHRLAAEVALILARPSAAYRPSLITFEVGRGVWWAGKPSMPTLIVDTSTTWRTKAAALRAYRSESQEWPDARSVRAVLDDDRALGTRAGVRYAEGFEIVRAFEGGLP